MRDFICPWILLGLCVSAAGQEPKALLVGVPLGIDVERSLGANNLVAGQGGGAANDTKLNAALLDRSKGLPFCFRGKRFDWHGTIDCPQRTGGAIVGAGFARNHSEAAYTGSGVGGIATRFCWMGNATDPMISVPGWGWLIDGLSIEGLPEGGTNRCNVGIHYRATAGSTPPNSAMLRLGRVGIDGCNYGILCGANATDVPDAGGDFPSQQANHADNIVIDQLRVRDIQTAGYWVRTDQSAQHIINYVQCTGMGPGGVNVPLFWFERGGLLKCNFAYMGGNMTLLKITKCTSNNGRYEVGGFRVDGSVSDIRLLQFDDSKSAYRSSQAHVTIANGVIPQSITPTYLIDCGTNGKACTIILRDIRGIPANSIRLNGCTVGSNKFVATLVLQNCSLRGVTAPNEVLDLAESDTSWRLIAINCTDEFTSGSPNINNAPYMTTVSVDGGGTLDVPIRTYKSPDL